MKRLPLTSLLILLTPLHASLVMHWKLDEANGDFTTGGYREEVSNSTLSAEVDSGTSVTEGSVGLAPGGGRSADFSVDDPDTYINAGSLEADGTHISGAASTQYVLGANVTISGWFRPDGFGGDRILASNQFNSNTGWMFGTTNSNIFMDFGNQRASYSPTTPMVVGNDYFLVVQQDPDGDSSFGWTAGANNRLSLYDVANATWDHFDGTQIKNGLNLNNVSIGKFTNNGREFDGLIDDIRIYDHTLSQADLDGMVAVPEPRSIALLSLAAIILFGRRRLR